jgi:peroxidase
MATRVALAPPMVAVASVAVLLVVCAAASVAGQGQLQVGYYNKTCPAAEQIVRNETTVAIGSSPDLAAALLRLHYHDCFVQVPYLATCLRSCRLYRRDLV